MKGTKTFLFLLIFLSALNAHAQYAARPYFHSSIYQMATPGAINHGLYGYENPAVLSTYDKMNLQFMWLDEKGQTGLKNWGLFMSGHNLGFNAIRSNDGYHSFTDYKLSMAGGDNTFSVGLSYGWTKGDFTTYERGDFTTLGFLFRPNRYLSIGASGSKLFNSNISELYTDVAVRPMGNEKLTLFFDYGLNNGKIANINKDFWSAGAAVEAIDGLRVIAKYYDTKQFSVGLQIGLGGLGLSSQQHFDKDSKRSGTVYGIRVGEYDRNLVTKLFPGQQYAKFDLNGPVKYQGFRFFDNSNTLSSLLKEIEAAKTDNNIEGLAINTSGLEASREMLWELREKLADFKTSGKKIVIFVDVAGMDDYYFASVADKIVMDPVGMLDLRGYVMGRTYYKGTLDKLGIGINEWRFFKFKSAMESFSSNKMSEADSLQRKELLDGFYNTVRSEISASRNFSPEYFDRFVNDTVMFNAETALRDKLIDAEGRWSDVEEIVKKISGKNADLINSRSVEKLRLPNDNRWSEPDKIAVVYALGTCDMDEGINARKLVNDLKSAGKNTSVKAIVLRVDSPGGDAMASDYIAEAVKEIKKNKPVIISQGAVAASGGYWLSMYGSQILASPFTITGSIGVIGGWIYNKGFKETAGMSTSLVKRGEHADLGFGATLPLIGLQIPDRNLTAPEFEKMKSTILGFYDGFTGRVAAGRALRKSYVDSVGQGRVWTGSEGLRLKLVDGIGGLDKAIQVAKEKAGIGKDEIVNIVEYPVPSMFDFSFLKPKLFGIETNSSKVVDDLMFRLRHNGQPVPMLPVDDAYTE